MIQVAPFYNVGAGWNKRRATPRDSSLASVGVGLRWLLGFGSIAQVYYGHALHRVSHGSSLEDQGVHFSVVTSLF